MYTFIIHWQWLLYVKKYNGCHIEHDIGIEFPSYIENNLNGGSLSSCLIVQCRWALSLKAWLHIWIFISVWHIHTKHTHKDAAGTPAATHVLYAWSLSWVEAKHNGVYGELTCFPTDIIDTCGAWRGNGMLWQNTLSPTTFENIIFSTAATNSSSVWQEIQLWLADFDTLANNSY